MRSTRPNRVLASLVATLFLANQPGLPYHQSVEWMVDDSTQIIVGKVKSESPGPGTSISMTVEVEQTLKGKASHEVSCVIQPRYFPDRELARIGESHARILLCLRPIKQSSASNDGYWLSFPAPKKGYIETSRIELDGQPNHQVFGLDAQPISNPVEVIAKFQAVIKSAPKKADKPRSLRLPFSRFVLEVPIDGRLEHQIDAWIESPDILLREMATKSLSNFRSPKNIALAKRMLQDPGVVTNRTYGSTGDGLVPITIVREAAKDVLDEWEIGWEPTPKPVPIEAVHVPFGSFTMGVTGADLPQPIQTVDQLEFWISRNDVTVGQFRQFCKATGFKFDWKGNRPRLGWKDNHPMVNVSWYEARAFCDWMKCDMPTAAQWEKATRGPHGDLYPWGNKFDEKRLHIFRQAIQNFHQTAPVGSYLSGASPYGCYDMLGNVVQWCQDASSGPDGRFVRGASFQASTEKEVIRGFGFWQVASAREPSLGFRLVWNSPPKL